VKDDTNHVFTVALIDPFVHRRRLVRLDVVRDTLFPPQGARPSSQGKNICSRRPCAGEKRIETGAAP